MSVRLKDDRVIDVYRVWMFDRCGVVAEDIPVVSREIAMLGWGCCLPVMIDQVTAIPEVLESCNEHADM